MTFFTDSPFEKMTIQRSTGRREPTPLVPVSPACASCPYRGQAPCVGYCLKQLREKNNPPLVTNGGLSDQCINQYCLEAMMRYQNATFYEKFHEQLYFQHYQ